MTERIRILNRTVVGNIFNIILLFSCSVVLAKELMTSEKKRDLLSVVDSIANAAAIGEVCEISNDISNQMRALQELVLRYEKVESASAGFNIEIEYIKKKSTHLKSIGAIKKAKICYVDKLDSKTAVLDGNALAAALVKKVLQEVEDSEISKAKYEAQLEQERQERIARSEQQRQREEEARKSAQRGAIDRYAQQVGRYIIDSVYSGGSNVSIICKSYEVGSSSLKMNLEMRWDGAVSGKSGYAAEGQVLITDLEAKTLHLNKGLFWNETWKSSLLAEFMKGRRTGEYFGKALRGY